MLSIDEDSDCDVVMKSTDSAAFAKTLQKTTDGLPSRTDSLQTTIAQIVSKNDREIDTMMNKLKKSIPLFDQQSNLQDLPNYSLSTNTSQIIRKNTVERDNLQCFEEPAIILSSTHSVMAPEKNN